MDTVEYIPGARLRHTDGSEATVTTVALAGHNVHVETDRGLAEIWPTYEISGFGVIPNDDQACGQEKLRGA